MKKILIETTVDEILSVGKVDTLQDLVKAVGKDNIQVVKGKVGVEKSHD